MTAPAGYFVSDLHLFASRSQGERHLTAIHRLSRQAQTFVLGGDIFDFKWSRLRCIDSTVAAAAACLAEMAEHSPSCQFHMVLGNHDHHPQFIRELELLDARYANLQWHPYHLRLGGDMFLHGDAADGDATVARLHRARNKPARHHRGPAAHWVYDTCVRAGLHRPVPLLAYPKRRTARQLLRYLGEVGHGPETGVEHVYFGHTHRAISGYRCGGVAFHNGGAPIQGVPFRIVPLEHGLARAA
jgi:UDP-2,3-diacylglucosamine hydrolase